MQNFSGNLVTLWTASTGQALGLTSAASLSDEELRQAHRFKQAPDRDRYLAARALLRHALSETLDGEIAPEAWGYIESPNGKPMMVPQLPQLEFNLSHAGDCVAVGVSASGPVGVDVENAIPDERLEIVNDALNQRERAHLSRQPKDRQWVIFLQFWTLKEACAKALGLGATLDFRELEIDPDTLGVVAPQGLLGLGKTFDIETREIVLDQCPYRLSIAKITDVAGETSFRFRPLTSVRD